MKINNKCTMGLLGVHAFLVFLCGVADANIILVNQGGDVLDHDRLCNIREAVQAANSDVKVGGCDAGTPGLDLIGIGARTIELEDELLITDSLWLIGEGESKTVISGQMQHRIFRVDMRSEGGVFALTGMKLSKGKADDGGAVYIHDAASVVLDSIRLSDNQARKGGGVYFRVVRRNDQMEIKNTAWIQNRADQTGGALHMSDVNGYEQYGSVMIADSLFMMNASAGAGGAIDLGVNRMQITGTDVSHNVSSIGGGLRLLQVARAEIESSSFIQNHAAVEAGGLYIQAAGDVTIANSTIAENSAHRAAAMYFESGELWLTSNTLADDYSGGPRNTLSFQDSTVYYSGNILNGIRDSQVDCGMSNSLAYSLGDNVHETETCFVPIATDLYADAKLLRVHNHFSEPPMRHFMLAPDSPAIDHGQSACLMHAAVDQLGHPRAVDGDGDGVAQCDSGSVELQ